MKNRIITLSLIIAAFLCGLAWNSRAQNDELNILIDRRISQRLENISPYPPEHCATLRDVTVHLANTIAALKSDGPAAEPIDDCEPPE